MGKFKSVIITVFLLSFWLSFLPGALAVEIKYAFKTGLTYEYEITKTDIAKTSSIKLRSDIRKPVEKHNFQIKVIDRQNDSFILDIYDESGTFRRYIKENGDLKGAPGETGQSVPVFLILPDGDWKVSEKKQIQKMLNIGSVQVPMIYNMQLASVDNKTDRAEIIFAVQMKLPEDRLRKKRFLMKGSAIFDLSRGVIESSSWTISYSFNFINREMAISRDLWSFEKQTSMTLTLKDVKE